DAKGTSATARQVARNTLNPDFQAFIAASSSLAGSRRLFVGRVYTPKPARLSARPSYRWTATKAPGSGAQNKSRGSAFVQPVLGNKKDRGPRALELLAGSRRSYSPCGGSAMNPTFRIPPRWRTASVSATAS